MTRIYFNQYEITIIKSISNLIDKRRNEESIRKKININAFSISKDTGLSYDTVKKYLNRLKDI